MKIGIIGNGAISRYVQAQTDARTVSISALLLRPNACEPKTDASSGPIVVTDVTDLPDDIDLMLDCAGHAALQSHGPQLLSAGIDLCTVSLGALADADLFATLRQSAITGNAKLHLASGAIGALDCLRAGRVGGLHSVTYTGRKPPQSWQGSPAEEALDLKNPGYDPVVHFEGSARRAATNYPKNANVAAAVALAGIGFDETTVQLIADPQISENIHEISAHGTFGRFKFEISGHALPDNPRSSALAAMSVVSKVEEAISRVAF